MVAMARRSGLRGLGGVSCFFCFGFTRVEESSAFDPRLSHNDSSSSSRLRARRSLFCIFRIAS